MSGGGVIEHYEDDGEYRAGRRLLDLLRDNDISDQMICDSLGSSKIQPYSWRRQTSVGVMSDTQLAPVQKSNFNWPQLV